MSDRIRWKTLVAESIAVVASILIAFSIDAWWDGRQEAEELLQTLRGLDSELTEVQQTAASNRERLLVELEVLRLFLSGSAEDLDAAAEAAQSGLYYPLTRTPVDPLESGFLNATIASGRLGLIPDSRTRVAITQLAELYSVIDVLLNESRRLGSDAATEFGRTPDIQVATRGRVTSPELAALLQANETLRGYANGRILNYEGYLYVLGQITALHAELSDLVRRQLE